MDATFLGSMGSAPRRRDRPFQTSFFVCFARALQACVNTKICAVRVGTKLRVSSVARFCDPTGTNHVFNHRETVRASSSFCLWVCVRQTV